MAIAWPITTVIALALPLVWGIALVASGLMVRQQSKATPVSPPGHTPSAPPSPA
ncbi:MAG TPA: hypothetical protein VFJ22_05250 [Dermatophilaceae bacterium]|nr:hypothetical protein [Dermatophilaceae bacterium]